MRVARPWQAYVVRRHRCVACSDQLSCPRSGWLSGLIIALVEANSYFVVFHACQSIVISIIYCLFAIMFALIDNLVIQPGGLNFSITSFIWFVLYLILSKCSTSPVAMRACCLTCAPPQVIVCCIFAVKNQESGDLFQLVLVGGLAEKMADKFFNAKYKRTRVKEVDEWVSVVWGLVRWPECEVHVAHCIAQRQ